MTTYIKKKCNTDDLVPGMQIGENVLTENGQVMLQEGAILTQSMITGLQCWDIFSIMIREAVSDETDSPIVVEETPLTIPISKQQQQFYDQYNATTESTKKLFGSMRYFKEAPIDELKNLADSAVLSMLESVGVINHLQMVRTQDDYTFQHSINVSVICGILGKWLGYSGSEITDLVLAGLLHDIGKSQIPLDILNKPDTLTAEEMKIMQTHSTLGYKLIKNNKKLSSAVIYGVLQHHERMDGSGYPLSVKADKLHPFARIVAIADTYDAMSSDRVYHHKITPFAVVEQMAAEMYNKLDPDICTVFLNNVRNYFIGNIVKLTDGRSAEVVYLGQFMGTRPTVCTRNGEFIDLGKNKNIAIVELMNA